jgi:hypothetical protein
MTEFERGWNSAIEAAARAIKEAPVFRIKNYGPLAAREVLMVLETCRKEVTALARDNQ